MKHTGKGKKLLAVALSLILALSFAPLFSVLLLPQANAAVATNRNSSNYVYGHYYHYPAGTNFIKSIHVGYDKDKDKAQSNAINDQNPYLLSQDWLDGMGSNIFKKYNYIYIAYGVTTNINEVWGTYIRMKHSSGTPSSYAFTVNGQSVNFTLGSDVDFNEDRGSGSDYIYLYKTNDPRYGLPITEFRSGEGNNDTAKWESYFLTAERDNTGEVSDFNRNAGGKYLWLHYGNYSVFTDVTTQVNAMKAALAEAEAVDTSGLTEQSRAALNAAIADAQPIRAAYDGNVYKCATYDAATIQAKTAALNSALNSLITAYYTVNFYGAGATGGAMTSQRLPINAARALSANGFTREFTVNYEYNGATGGNAATHDVAVSQFANWATSLYGPKAYDNQQSVSALATENGTVDLYANWTDSTVTLPEPTREGYTFSAWYSDPSLSSNYRVGVGGASYTPPANTTLYAKWEEATYHRIGYTTGSGYTVTKDPDLTAKHTDTVIVKLTLNDDKYGCDPVITINTGTVEMQPYNPGSFKREYHITGISADYTVTIGDAVPPTYTVTFVDSLSGEVLKEETGLSLGASVTPPDVDDYVDYTADQHLIFTGWDKPLTNGNIIVNGNLTVTTEYEAENHTWDDGTVTTPATCTEPGEKTVHCNWCTASKNVEIPAGNHSFTRKIADADHLKTAATCGAPAEYFYTCANCDVVSETDTFTYGDPVDHDYTKAEVKDTAKKSDATCTDPAVYYYSCRFCGAVEHNDDRTFTNGNANGHSFQWVVDKNANCGETGLKHEECTVCHEKRSENTVIEVQGEHQFEWIVDEGATCVEPGSKHEECSVCHATRSENTVIDPTGAHTLSKTAAVAVTCTTDGSVEYWTCSVCRQKFADDAAQNTITDEEIVIRHQGHDFSAQAAEAKYFKSAATCTEAAVYYKSCVNCGEKGTETFVSGNPNGHSFYWVTDTAATCAEPGVKHEKCRNCTETRSMNTVIDPTGNHSYTMQTVKPEAKKSDATCTAPAVYYYSCATCGAVEGNDNHTFKNGSAQGHTFGDWVTDREPSCADVGLKHRACTKCGFIENGSIDKLSHTDNDGDYKCDDCGADVTPAGVCPYCHKTHGGGFDAIIGFFHRILYFFKNLFG